MQGFEEKSHKKPTTLVEKTMALVEVQITQENTPMEVVLGSSPLRVDKIEEVPLHAIG